MIALQWYVFPTSQASLIRWSRMRPKTIATEATILSLVIMIPVSKTLRKSSVVRQHVLTWTKWYMGKSGGKLLGREVESSVCRWHWLANPRERTFTSVDNGSPWSILHEWDWAWRDWSSRNWDWHWRGTPKEVETQVNTFCSGSLQTASYTNCRRLV